MEQHRAHCNEQGVVSIMDYICNYDNHCIYKRKSADTTNNRLVYDQNLPHNKWCEPFRFFVSRDGLYYPSRPFVITFSYFLVSRSTCQISHTDCTSYPHTPKPELAAPTLFFFLFTASLKCLHSPRLETLIIEHLLRQL